MYSEREVLTFVEENDVKFVKLTFCDLFGGLKNISILADQLPRAFSNGFGIDGGAAFGLAEEGDLFLVPDPSTLVVLPWRPQTGRVARLFCGVRRADGTPFEGDGRAILQKTCARAASEGLSFGVGSECEFYLFETDERGLPQKIPHDCAGYLDPSPMDKGENVRRDICLTLEQMGVSPVSSQHKQGPGQNEITFVTADPLRAADNFLTFRSVVKVVSARSGLFASFMPKPLPEAPGSGLSVNFTLSKEGKNLFDEPDRAESFCVGILARIREMTLFLNPTANSYRRFGGTEAPAELGWSGTSRARLARIPGKTDPGGARVEIRSPDAACNPYLAFALLLEAGLEGMREGVKDFSAEESLPAGLGEAVALARESAFVRRVLPEEILKGYFAAKEREWVRFRGSEKKFEDEIYFRGL